MRSVTVSVPASTANLGSGYDAYGLALARYNRFTATFAAAGEWHVEVTDGEHARRNGRDNLVAASMRRLFDEVGETRGASVTCVNDVPFGRGLGSSSTAIVGGLVAANELTGARLAPADVFRLAAEMEGHADNVAAALFGGFTICWSDAGAARSVAIDPPGGLAAVCVISEQRLSTHRSRTILPEHVPHADAAYDAGRAGLLAIALALDLRDLIGPGMSDRIHEPYRAAAVTDLEAVRTILLEAGAHGAALSGAGPTVIGLVAGTNDAEATRLAGEVANRAAGPIAACAGRLAPEVIAIDRDGAVVVE